MRELINACASLYLAAIITFALFPQSQQPTGGEPLRQPRDEAGIWIGLDDIMTGPTSGAVWSDMLSTAQSMNPSNAAVWDQDSKHDVETLATALCGVRLDDQALKTKALDGLLAAIGTEVGDDWLAVSRNLTAYTVAADVLRLAGVNDPAVDAWLEDFVDGTIQLPNNAGQGGGCCRPINPFHSGSNAATQEGCCFIAIAAYLDRQQDLEYGWQRWRVFIGDRPVTDPYSEGPEIGEIDISNGLASGWVFDPNDPKPVNPAGSVLVTGGGVAVDVDGVIVNDQRRGGSFDWPPGYTQYVWVGLEGAVPAAVILQRCGYPAFAAASQGVRRAVECQWRFGQILGQSPFCTSGCWWDYDRATDVKHLANWIYGTSYPYETPVGIGRTMGFTDWTHR